MDWLGTPALSWRDLLVICRNVPRTSALFRSMHPDDYAWGLSEQLLAAMFDALNGANWQRGGGKGPHPTPLERPGVRRPSKHYGTTALPMDDMARRLGWEVSDGE